MFFRHERGVTGGIATSWLLEVSNEIAQEVTAVYAGNDSVRTFQIMTIENVLEEPEDVDAICSVVLEKLAGKLKPTKFALLAVQCSGYTYEPLLFERGLRRRLAAGDLVVQFEVHAEYTPAKRGEEEDDRDGEFAALVEVSTDQMAIEKYVCKQRIHPCLLSRHSPTKDSINRDQGKELSNTLREREIIAMQDDGRVQTAEKITERPTRAPTEKATTLSTPADEPSSNTTGIAVIVVCSVVAVLIAGFFLYKGFYAKKKIEVDPYFISDDYSSVDYEKPKHTRAQLLPGNDGVEVHREEPRQDAVHAGGDLNIFGNAVGASGTSRAKDGRDWQDEKVDLHEGITRSEQNNINQGSGKRRGKQSGRNQGRDQLDAFESRVRQKGDPDGMARGESQKMLSAFDARLQRKLSGSSSRRQDAHNESISTLESFEDRVLKKSGSGKPDSEHRSSSSRLEEFDERLQQKLERSRGRSPGRSAQDAFDERVRRKASSGNGGNKASGASRGNSVDSQESASSFDKRLKKKLSRSRSRGNSVDSQGSGSSFEDRLKRKLSNSSTDRSGALASTPSSRRLDDFETRILAKRRDEDKSRSRESSPGGPDMSRKLSHGSAASFEDRLEEKLRKSSSSRGALASSTSSHNLDEFEARVAAKSREGSAAGRPLRASSSSEDFEARLAAKTRDGKSSRSRDTSPGSAPSYEDRLKKKLNERARSSGGASSSSSSQVLDDLEARISAKNIKEGKRERSLDSMPGAHSSSSRHMDAFNARIAAKSKEGGESRAHSQSLGAESSSSALDNFNARVEAKSKEGGTGPESHNRQASKARFQSAFQKARAINTMKDLGHSEARSKARVEHNERTRKQLQVRESGRSLQESPGPASSYEDRLRQKLTQGSSEASRGRPSSRTLSATPSSRNLDDFEARIAEKAKKPTAKVGDGSSERARSSLTASTSSSSSRALDDLEARIAAKNKGNTSSRTSSSSLSSFESKLNQKLQRNSATGKGSPSQSLQKTEGGSRNGSSLRSSRSSQSSALSSFESKLEQKLAASNAKKNESASGSAKSASGTFEERLERKLADKKRQGKK